MRDPIPAFKVLVCDLVGLADDGAGMPDHSAVRDHIENKGGRFIAGSQRAAGKLEPGVVHFFYLPELRGEDEIVAETAGAGYDALIAAATLIPAGTEIARGAVRIGTGTGNMRSAAWGGGDGRGGHAVLMNTPGINARATAQMVLKAILRRTPDLPLGTLHDKVMDASFDTGRDLRSFPTSKLEGKRIAVLGYGNIGREVAHLAAAFRMDVVVYARPRHRQWIESEGFAFAASAAQAAANADVLSVHLGLGPLDPGTGKPVNTGVVGDDIIEALATGATLVNFDRGELVDVDALDRALASGRVAYAAIDADVFVDANGVQTGPLAPYVPLARRYPDKLLLLPHAAADTDHPSRVAGATQAVDMIFDLLINRTARNVVGDLPDGHIDGGAVPLAGLGGVTKAKLEAFARDRRAVEELAACAGQLARFYAALAQSPEADIAAVLADHDVSEATRCANRATTILRQAGLTGGYSG